MIMRPFFSARVLPVGVLAAWFAVSLTALGLLVFYQYTSGLSELSERTRSMEMLLAERLAQHDAHLSGLGAVIRMSPHEPSSSIQGLAENIITRYPRISNIATFNISGETARVIAYGTASGASPSRNQPTSELPRLAKVGETAVRPSAIPNAYEIFKLVEPNRILRLRIDADLLLNMGHEGGQYSSVLSLDNTALFSSLRSSRALLTASDVVMTSNHSQPLNLTVSRGFGLRELFPPHLALPLLVTLTAITWLLKRYQDASRERQRQERRAMLLEQDAKLAHASRVNAMGEMASGIAHELAQPIAAILSQSQAARRALTIERPDILEKAIDANIRDARRAGDILGRMRAYISGAAARIEEIPLTDAVTEALQLVHADLAQRGITLKVTFSDQIGTGKIDLISFQQVIHNVIRNAADAIAGGDNPTIALDAYALESEILITISDNGPGIEPASLDRIFDPFFTTKEDGMGLGLPLSSRLIEKMNGSIEVCNDGGARFTIRLPAGAMQ